MSKLIPLANGRDAATVDDADLPFLARYHWRLTGKGYVGTYFHGQWEYMHRLLLGLTPGDGIDVDHRNGDRLDNRRSNLRRGSRSQNLANQQKTARPTTSRFKGVSWVRSKRRWRARISDGTRDGSTFLGYFEDEEDAARAYDTAAVERHGEFAVTNF